MRIGIDARELAGRPTGVGRYLSGLLTHWARLPETSAHQFVLYSAQAGGPIAADAERAGLAVERRSLPGASGTWWEQARLPLAMGRDRLDVLFAPAYTAPLATRVPVVLAIHDLSFMANPAWFRPRERMRRTWLTTRSAHKARTILTDSEFSKREIVERLRIPQANVTAIPLGISVPDARSPTAIATDGHEPLVLFVGSIFNRRHVPTLIRAFADVARDRPDVRLEIVGDNRTYPYEDLTEIAAQARVSGHVTIRRYVDDRTLASLYARATVFAFLSEYEGFGLPPLEALAFGIPVVLEDTAIARETCGLAARYVPKGDLATTSAALKSLLFDRAARDRVLVHAPDVLRRYSWEQAARLTLAAIERAAG